MLGGVADNTVILTQQENSTDFRSALNPITLSPRSIPLLVGNADNPIVISHSSGSFREGDCKNPILLPYNATKVLANSKTVAGATIEDAKVILSN